MRMWGGGHLSNFLLVRVKCYDGAELVMLGFSFFSFSFSKEKTL